MTIADKLLALDAIKTDIAEAIEAQGVTVGDVPFDEYATKIALIESSAAEPDPWVRPDWPTLPTLTESDQKFVGVHAVYENDGNFCALSAAGAYTVDWGDGVVENYAADVVAYHAYSFADDDLPTATSRGYKCAVVTVTPQAGQSFTTLNLHQKYNTANLQAYASGFLDIEISGANLTDIRIGASLPSDMAQNITFNLLERVAIRRSDLKNATGLLRNSRSLQKVVDVATSADPARNIAVTFSAGNLATSVGHGLKNTDPLVLNSIVTTTGITVGSVYYVINATPDTFQVSTTHGGAAATLTGDGGGAFAAGTSFGSMFSGCPPLQTIPLLNTAAGTNFSNMFQSCSSLQTIPPLNTAAGTSFSSMFSGCPSLQTIPLLNTAAGTSFGGMFQSCSSLQTIPLLNTAAGTNFGIMFSNCPSLQTIPPLNTAAGTTFSSMFSGCSSLQRIDAAGFSLSFSVANCKLSASALNSIYTNLPTVTGKTITVSGNHGTSADDPSIATTKGWTVSGS